MGAILVGNKSDLNEYKVSKEAIMEYAKQKKMEYVASSAKKNINVNDIFVKLLDNILKKNKGKKIKNENVKILGRITTTEEEEIKKKKKCC